MKYRLEKTLDHANIELSSVLFETFGASAGAIIDELIWRELTVKKMAGHAKERLGKREEEFNSSKSILLGR
ncbi:MAG: hypothetical protein ACFFCW_28120 [Candidatus Hodarchaeota archaeon]